MNITITNSDGKWLINGKPYNECTYAEQRYFIEFINAMKYED